MLRDRDWQIKYTRADGDLVKRFYVPALSDAVRYDRLTGYFNAQALSLAARGIEGLVRNDGHMRLVVGCTLEEREVEAIRKGQELRERVEQRLAEAPLAPWNRASFEALELLSWLVASGRLDVKVAIPCGQNRKPVDDDSLFHQKVGIVEDRGGDHISWIGSLNETAAGWQRNSESFQVFTSWVDGPRADQERRDFASIWANQNPDLVVMDVPSAAHQLMQFLPKDDMPARLKEEPQPLTADVSPAPRQNDLRERVWSFIRQAPTMPNGGDLVGEATAPVDPWPHQTRAFDRLYQGWPPRLLIADEVGLGKTIQAGLLLRQAWLAGRAKRTLILAPKAVLGQWQVELRDKFNLNWPIFDGTGLRWHESPALKGGNGQDTGPVEWNDELAVIASSQLMRRKSRAQALLDTEPWDLVVVDEAHHARTRGSGGKRRGPNNLLALLQKLEKRTSALLLLTATPMQVDPLEVWDLLGLLGLPREWTDEAFLFFFESQAEQAPSADSFERMAQLYQAVVRRYGRADASTAHRVSGLSTTGTDRVLRGLNDPAATPRRRLTAEERQAAIRIMRSHSPIRTLVSRHTRDLLRRYSKSGELGVDVAEREVTDHFLALTPDERRLYEAVEDYIENTYQQASATERNALGFALTIYRRRLASSFGALHSTLQRRLDAIEEGAESRLAADEEDADDDETVDEVLDTDEAAELERQALANEEIGDIRRLLERIEALPPDSKLSHLTRVITELREADYEQAMVFTQYTDTMDFLREQLAAQTSLRLMCYSGRGGEVPSPSGAWQCIERGEARRRFQNGEADVLLCTDAAAEGLNFQFCGAVVNYDMPWNPMRVEQRIGRIDRVGQKKPVIRVVNLHYEDTVETDVYRSLSERIGLFESVVGPLQPILARLPHVIKQAVLRGASSDAGQRASVVNDVVSQAQDAKDSGFDIDQMTEQDLAMPSRGESPVTLDDLRRVLTSPNLMPPDTKVEPLDRDYQLQVPGLDKPLRVTTDTAFFENHAESVELFSPGNPVFKPPQPSGRDEPPTAKSLKELLDSQASD